MREQVIQMVEEEKIIAIVRGIDAEKCMKVADALYEGGKRCKCRWLYQSC